MSQSGISADLMNTSITTDLETPVERSHKLAQAFLMIIMLSLSHKDANNSPTSPRKVLKRQDE